MTPPKLPPFTVRNSPLSGGELDAAVPTEAFEREGHGREQCSGVDNELEALLATSLANNTVRAYRSDLLHFLEWGGTIPSDQRTIARYVASQARLLKPATIARRLASISAAHRLIPADDPTKALIVKRAMRGLRRSVGTAQRKAIALRPPQVVAMLAAGDGTVRAIRDDAWLLLGFCSGLRRSELAGIRVEHLEFRLNHLSVVIARGKTDQDGRGRTVFFPRLGETALCPVRAVERWLKVAAISKGALFRRVSRSGGVLASGMSDRWVSESLKRRLEAAGLSSNGYSAHSLRAGFITTSILRGLDAASIMRQTGHSNPSAFVGYMRPLEQDLCESLSRLMEEKAVDGEN